jgi:hypothetical protein
VLLVARAKREAGGQTHFEALDLLLRGGGTLVLEHNVVFFVVRGVLVEEAVLGGVISAGVYN